MIRSLLARSAVLAAAVAVVTVALAAPASAHVTVNPNSATQGGYAKVTFRVPNETDTADTTGLEVNLPAGTPFASVSLKPVQGWTAVAVKTKLATPVTVHGTEITEAVSKITWTATAGAAVKPGQFQEFDVSFGPMPEVPQVVFKALQTYSDGTVVRWIDEPAADGSEVEHPAPTLKLTPAAAAATAPGVTAVAAAQGDGDGTPWGIAGTVLGALALLLGGFSLSRSRKAPAPAAAPVPEAVDAGR
jgi:uncharacterized protein YcnI